jgi:hypothetical protein
MPKTSNKNIIVSYTIDIPSAMYRYISGSNKSEIVFRDRNRTIYYPINTFRGLNLAIRLVLNGKRHVTYKKN